MGNTRRIGGGLLLIAILGGGLSLAWPRVRNVASPVLERAATSAAAPDAPTPVSPGKTPAAALQNFTADELRAKETALHKELLATAVELQNLVEQAGLDAGELNERYNELSEDAFYASLPTRVREGYEKLHAQVHQLQDVNLAQDGVSREFFKQQPSESAPQWVADHAIALEKLPLPEAVEHFVELKSQTASIEDADLRTVAALCSRRWACVEKSVYQWIKANHQLSDEQFKLLAEYQKED